MFVTFRNADKTWLRPIFRQVEVQPLILKIHANDPNTIKLRDHYAHKLCISLQNNSHSCKKPTVSLISLTSIRQIGS